MKSPATKQASMSPVLPVKVKVKIVVKSTYLSVELDWYSFGTLADLFYGERYKKNES